MKMGKYSVAIFDTPDIPGAVSVVVLDDKMNVKSYEVGRGETQVERLTTMALRRVNMLHTMIQPPEL